MSDPQTVSDVFVAALLQDVELANVIGDRLYAASSLGQGEMEGGNPAAPEMPYAVYNELPSNAREVEETSNAQNRFFAFYIYDQEGVNVTINSAMRRVRAVMKSLAPFATLDEGRCIESKWLGISGFMPDPAYGAHSRYGTVRLLTSE